MLDPCLFGPIDESEKTAVWEVTKQCNLKCPHCCSNSGYDYMEKDYQDMPLEKALEYVDILHRNDIKVIYFSGGEPLLWKPLVAVLKKAREYNITCCLATSGYVNNRALWEELVNIDIYSFHVSLDSYCAEQHDKFRGVKGAFERALAFIDYMKSHGKSVVTSTMISESLIENIDEMLDILHAHKVDRAVLNFFVPLGRASSLDGAVIPFERKKKIAADFFAKAKRKNVLINIKRVEQAVDGLQKCPAGSALIHINAYGQVSPCSWVGKLWPDLVQPITETIFRSEVLEEFDRRVHSLTDEKCSACRFSATCGRGCPVIAYFDGKHYDVLCNE